jgi:glycosyltransferase 2 family protein
MLEVAIMPLLSSSRIKKLLHSKLLNLAAKLGLSLGGLWVAFHDVDFEQLSIVLSGQAYGAIAVVAALIGMHISLGAVRWQLITRTLAAAEARFLSVAEALRLYYISTFFSVFLVGTVGSDVVRVWMARALHVPLPLAINSVIIDRILALLSLSLLVLINSPLLGVLLGFDAVHIIPGVFVAGLFGLWLLFRSEKWLAPYAHWKPIHWFLHFVSSLSLLRKHPLAFMKTLGYAMTAHLCYCLYTYVLAMSLGIEISLLECVILMPLVLLMITLPISIGGWGVREVGMVGLLGVVGVPKEAALTLSIEQGLISMAVAIPAALLWMAQRKKLPPQGPQHL